MDMPLVSIIIPVYNAKEYLGVCIDGVLSQDYDNIEVIVVDDGSDDDSAKQYAGPKIKVFEKENGGVSSARNYGISHASGELITFVDVDDTIGPQHISALVNGLLVHSADCAVCGYYYDYPSVSKKRIFHGLENMNRNDAVFNMLKSDLYQ